MATRDGRWLRWPGALRQQPKVRAAGGWGGLVYGALAELCELHGLKGRVPPLYATPAVLAQHLNFGPADGPAVLEGLARGIADATAARLLVARGDVLELADWEQFDGRRKNREKVARWRDGRRRERRVAAAGADPVTSPPERDTARDGTSPSPSPPPGFPPLGPPPSSPPSPPPPSANVDGEAVTSQAGEEAASPTTAEAPWRDALCGPSGGLVPVDPREAPTTAVVALAAALERRTAAAAADPVGAWFGDLQAELVRLGRPDGLTGRPALTAFREMLDALRRDGVGAGAAAEVLARAPMAALPSEVLRGLRRGLPWRAKR